MFRGLAGINLDEKGRMAIPCRYRSLLAEEARGNLIVTIDTEQPCLLLYPLSEWEVIEQKLVKLSSFQPASRRIQRLLLGHATELNMDKQGRVLLPGVLRDFAKIGRGVMFVGQGNKFEIWSADAWQTGRAEWLSESSDELPDELTSLSL